MKPHYQRIRKVKTHSGATAIQVGRYAGKQFKLTKHIGSSRDPQKISELLQIGQEYIRSHSPQLPFNFNPQSDEILFKRGITIEKSCLEEAFVYLEEIYTKVGFSSLKNEYLKYFAIIRVLEPASKTKSLLLLEKYFDIVYKKMTAFRGLEKLVELKEDAQKIAIEYAKKHFNFDFSLVFYDVTTLYFETHKQDEFRKNGFSKDNKINQPQILIGLIVNDSGFPLYYDIFAGNTFEGKTIIPVITGIKEKYRIDTFTVIADAGMLSEKNLEELEKKGIKYVVGARLGYLNLKAIKEIAEKLNRTDKKILRVEDILYEYSATRAKKDKTDTDKQVAKANYYLKNPAKVLKRSQFLTTNEKQEYSLNEALIE